MVNPVTKESLAARIAELESGTRSLKEDYTLAAYKMLLATMEAEPVYQVEGTVEEDENGQVTKLEWVDVPYSVAVMACDEFGLLTRTLYKSPPPAQVAPVVPELDEREAFEAFMEGRFGDTVDRRRAKNGDQGYMAWDMAMAWVVWEARARKQK